MCLRKIFHLIVFVLLVLSTIQIVQPFGNINISAAPPPPDDGVNGAYIQYIEGDWEVTSTESYSDEIILLNGSLNIQDGGSLTLRNVTLMMNCTENDDQFGIYVYGGGSLIITDGDNDPASTDDFSKITDSPYDNDNGTDPDYHYQITIYFDADFSMNNTNIRQCGYSDVNIKGLRIYTTNDVDIENCTFIDCAYGIYYNNDGRINIQNCTFINNSGMGIYIHQTIDFVIKNNVVSYSGYGINTYYWPGRVNNGVITNNEAHHCVRGMHFGGDNLLIRNNNVHNNSKKGIQFNKLFNSDLSYNTLSDNGLDPNWNWHYSLEFFQCNNLQVHHNTIQRTFRNISRVNSAVYIYQTSNFDFYNNSVINNNCYGIRCFFTSSHKNVRILNNVICNSNQSGSAIYMSSNVQDSYIEIKNNYIHNYSGEGIVVDEISNYSITNNTIDNTTQGGVYLEECGGSDFSNNTIGGILYDIKVDDTNTKLPDATLEATNCTFNLSNVILQDSRSFLIVKNFLHVNVTDVNGPAPLINVTIENVTNVNSYTGQTGHDGFIRYIRLANKTISKNDVISNDPYNITATFKSTEAYGDSEPIMDGTRTVNVHFNIDLPPRPATNLEAVSNGINVDLTWAPSPSPDIRHYLIYRNSTGSDWEEMFNSSSRSLPEERLWTNWTDIQGASNCSTYRYQVVAVDFAWQQSTASNIAKCGDWAVDNELVVVGLNVDLNGSLIILPSANLTLQNCKIQFNNSLQIDGGYGVEVQPGSKLSILDSDNDPATTADQTIITMVDNTKNSFFSVSNADFTMRNSRLSNFGFDSRELPPDWEIDSGHDMFSMGEPRNRGLYIQNSVVTIESNLFSNNFASILLDEVSYGVIDDNTFSVNTFGIFLNNSDNNSISNNGFTNHLGFPIYLFNSDNNSILSNIIMNYVNAPAGIGLYEFGCQDNIIFNNNITRGDEGIFIYYCGLNNNISYNNLRQSFNGINIEYTYWCSLFENEFNDISNIGCIIQDSNFVKVIGGRANSTGYGYYFDNSENSVIAMLSTENASSSGIRFVNIYNIRCVNIIVKNCYIGITVSGGHLIHHKEIIMSDCIIGFYCTSYPTDIYIFNSSLVSNIDQGVVVANCEDVILINCTLDATIYNFNLTPGGVTLINSTYNQTKVRLLTNSHMGLYWFLDVQVIDWYGNPAVNTDVQIREVLGTLAYNGQTDSNGYVRWRMLLQRHQYSSSNESATPYLIRSNSGKHWGSTTTYLNQSLLETVYLENTGPDASNILITPSNPTTTSDIMLNYTYSDSEDDLESNTYIKWFVDGIHKTAFNNQTQIESTNTNKDETWYCEIIPYDGATYGTPMTSMPVTIKNTKPEVSNVAIVQTAPRSSEDLHINYTYSDIDTDPELGSLHKWMVNDGTGWQYSGQDIEILNASFTEKGEMWKCEVKPYDGDDYGDAVQSPAVTIGNAKPEVSNLKVNPNNPKGNESINTEYDYYDLDNDPESNSIIKWYKNDIEQQQLANKSTVEPIHTMKGDSWHFAVIPFDGLDYGKQVKSEFVVIGNTPPKVANIVIKPINPTTSDDLTIKYDFSDNDGDNESFDTRIEWLRKREGDFEFTHGGWKVSTLSAVYTYKSEIWTCEVTPHDGLSYGTTVRCDVEVTIGNSIPLAQNGYITPIKPTTTDILQANYQFTDLDSDLESGSEIVWYRDQEAIPDLNNKMTVSSEFTKKGQVWYFTVQPSDGKDLGEIVKSSNIIIQNSLPTAKNVTITPKSPTGKDDLTINYKYFDEDSDSEGTPEIIWYENGIHQPEYDNLLTVDSESVKKGKNWHFDIRVFDGTDYSDWISSNHPLIGNSYVVADSITPSIDTVKTVLMNESEKQIFQIIASDPDNDDIDYEWLLDGVLIGSDFQYVFETSYDGEFDEGRYDLMLVFGDHDTDKSDWTSIEWEIIVSDVNRPPILVDKAPISTNLVVKVSKSLKFSVQATDPDADDKLLINWFFDGVDTGTPGSSYAYVGKSEHLAGSHQVKVEITDGEVVIEYSWNVTVEEEKEDTGERLYGQTYDWWGLVGTVITSIVGAILFLFGFFKMRKKKSKLREHLDQIEEIIESDKLPLEKENELKELKKEIKKEFSSESIIENHYIILMQHVDNAIGEIRTGLLEERVAMPEELKGDVQEVLGDGIVTKDEFSEIVNRIRTTKDLTPIEKNKLTGMLSRWMMEGKSEEKMLPRKSAPPRKNNIKKGIEEESEEGDDEFDLD